MCEYIPKYTLSESSSAVYVQAPGLGREREGSANPPGGMYYPRYLPSFSVDVNCNRPGTNISHKLPPSTNTMIVCTQGQTPFFISQIAK